MDQYKVDFIKLLVQAEALKFGEFKLKSGRIAPYFLNAGCFHTGELIHQLGKFYAQALLANNLRPNVLFGPAYKGIPLSVATVTALFSEFGENVSYCFNRKEMKDYGDAKGNVLVGAELSESTRVVLIDDVITAGTAVRESVELLKASGNPKLEGVLIAMNRMEKNNDGVNAIADLEDRLKVPVHAIVDLDDVIEALHNKEVDGKVYIDDAQMEVIEKYRAEYGI